MSHTGLDQSSGPKAAWVLEQTLISYDANVFHSTQIHSPLKKQQQHTNKQTAEPFFIYCLGNPLLDWIVHSAIVHD